MTFDEDLHYVVPEGYHNEWYRDRNRVYSDILAEAASRITGGNIVISAQVPGSSIFLWNSTMREPTRRDLENRAVIPKRDVSKHAVAFLLYSSNMGDDYEKLTVQDVFSIPAGQMPRLVQAMMKVGNYEGPFPFHCEVFPKSDFKYN